MEGDRYNVVAWKGKVLSSLYEVDYSTTLSY